MKNKINLFRSKRVVLPGINLEMLVPLSSVLFPGHFLFSIFGNLILAQLVFFLKGFLSNLEIQYLSSVQFYSRFISSNYYINSLSVYYSISQTLGFDLELLLSLNVFERLLFFIKLEQTILRYKGSSKVFSELNFVLDPISLLSHRKGLALKSRTIFLLSPIFSPTSLVVNILLSEVDLSLLIESSKFMWLYVGLDIEDFNFLLYKHYFSLSLEKNFFKLDFVELFIILVHAQLKKLVFFETKISFTDDFIVLKSKDNLTLLERQILCFYRPFPFFSDNIFSSTKKFKDSILKAAYNQKFFQRKKFQLSYTSFIKQNF